MKYKFKLEGLKTPDGTISIRALQFFVNTLTETSERGEYSRSKFHLDLSNGQTILGTIDRDILSVEDMRKFWGKKVTVKGILHFHPGRKI